MKSLQLAKPHLVVVVGIPGAGKTFFAEQFSKTFSAPYLHDSEIRTLTGDDASAAKVYDYTLRQLCLTQRTIIVEGRGNSRAERAAMIAQMYPLGYDIVFIWIQTETITAEARVQRPAHVKSPKRANFEILTPNENHIVISGRHTYSSQAKNVLKNLVSARIQTSKAVPAVPARQAPPIPDQFGRVRQGRLRIN